MTKSEKKKIIDVLDLMFENTILFSKDFDFTERKDALAELQCRADRVTWLSEFLEECGFISDDKYLEIVDAVHEMWDNLNIGENKNDKRRKEISN